MFLALTQLPHTHASNGGHLHLDELHFQVDNTIEEDKNHVFSAHVGFLVGRSAVGRA